jgi:hypothetical protein
MFDVLFKNTSAMKLQPTQLSSSVIVKAAHSRTDTSSMATKPVDIRTSPMKTQQTVHHPQLIIQPTSISTTGMPATSLSNLSAATTTSTLFVAPRIINFQTVVPKPTTNIQIGNTKIILVSPSNITQHLPHTTTSTCLQATSSTAAQQQSTSSSLSSSSSSSSSSCLLNNSPVKLMKFNTTNTMHTRSMPLSINSSPTSTLTLPKNVQIVIPSQTSSTLQLSRTHGDDMNKSVPTTATFRPITTVPMTLTTCSVNQIPQAAQEVTITTSPVSSPPLINTTCDNSQTTSIGTRLVCNMFIYKRTSHRSR